MVSAVLSHMQPSEQIPVNCKMSSDTVGLGHAGNCRKDVKEFGA